MTTAGPPLRRLLDVVEYLVDSRVGIIRDVREIRPEPGAPDFFHFAAQACNSRAFSQQKNFGSGGGAATHRERGLAKAVGECVERYCAALYDIEEFPLTSSLAAPFACVDPASFALYSQEQYGSPNFPWVRFDGDTPIRWTPSVDLSTGESVHVPASFVYIPYFPQRGGESPVGQSISTGLACHCSPAEAALAALCEVVERDAFMITWQAQLAPPRILFETLSEENRDLVERFTRTGCEIILFDVTVDHGISTVLSVVRTAGSSCPALSFAAYASMSAEHAVRGALEELAHTWRYGRELMSKPAAFRDDFADVVKEEDHLRIYCDRRNARLAQFLFESDDEIEFGALVDRTTGTPAGDLAAAVERIASTGHRVLVSDVTTLDVEPLGLSVVRAVVPGFHPLFMGYPIRALGGTRLWEVPQRLGYRGITRATGDNPAPHPFP